MKQLLRRKIKDKKLLRLLDLIVDMPVPDHPPGKGLALGNLTSQWMANLYLDRLDHFLKDEKGVRFYVRYMDDFVLLADSKEDLHWLRADVAGFLRETLRLEFKERGCFIAPVHEGLPFLGYRIYPGTIRLNHRGLTRFSRKYKNLENRFMAGKADEDEFHRSVTGMMGHVTHANTMSMRRALFHGIP